LRVPVDNRPHRSQGTQSRFHELAGRFAVAVRGFSVMSNHLHLVLRNRPDIAGQWSDDEIALRWCRLFPPRDDATGQPVEPGGYDLAMITANAERLAEVRRRLANLSWFMRCLCEKIARTANREDGSAGRFWAGRFKSVALLDEAAILACSVYIDLNPIRAGIATTPEESAYTSGRDRIRGMLNAQTRLTSEDEPPLIEPCERPNDWLCELTVREKATEPTSTTADRAASIPQNSHSQTGPAVTAVADAVIGARPAAESGPFVGVAATRRRPVRASDQGYLPIEVEHYVRLLDWTGRELRADKRGAIPDHLGPIMQRLGLDQSNWVETVRDFGRLFKQAAGRSTSLVDAAARRSRRWFQGKTAARAAFV
jgi:REP element-mobilizing transposase RayT